MGQNILGVPFVNIHKQWWVKFFHKGFYETVESSVLSQRFLRNCGEFSFFHKGFYKTVESSVLSQRFLRNSGEFSSFTNVVRTEGGEFSSFVKVFYENGVFLSILSDKNVFRFLHVLKFLFISVWCCSKGGVTKTEEKIFIIFFKNLVIELDREMYGPDNHLVEVFFIFVWIIVQYNSSLLVKSFWNEVK